MLSNAIRVWNIWGGGTGFLYLLSPLVMSCGDSLFGYMRPVKETGCLVLYNNWKHVYFLLRMKHKNCHILSFAKRTRDRVSEFTRYILQYDVRPERPKKQMTIET